MGNLYTHLVKSKGRPEISILSKLKQAWKARPIDYNHINELRKQLAKLQMKNKKEYPPTKLLTSSFNGTYSNTLKRFKSRYVP